MKQLHKRKDRVLEIGTSSGYQAAVLTELAGEVYTIEIVPERSDWTLVSYALMSSHVYLALMAGEEPPFRLLKPRRARQERGDGRAAAGGRTQSLGTRVSGPLDAGEGDVLPGHHRGDGGGV